MISSLERRIKSSLNSSSQHLEADTKQRLQAIRREALNQPKKTVWSSLFNTSFWMPAASVTFCSIIAAMLFLPQLQNTKQTNPLDQTAMYELLNDPETLDVLSDPDFYLWVDEFEAQSV